MATLSDAAKAVASQAIVDLIGAAGILEIGDSGFANTLSTVPLQNPAATVDGAGVITISVPDVDPNIAVTGTAAEARIRDGSSADIITGLTVGTGAEEIVVNDASFVNGQTFTLESGVLTPA